MDITIKKARFEDIKEKLLTSINDQCSYIDSFLEEHILKSEHYEILSGSKQIGYFSIFENNLLTQFYLDSEFRGNAQEIFDRIKRYENIQKAFVPTSDEFFLSHAFDYSKRIDPQAYFFKDSKVVPEDDKLLVNFECKLASNVDIDFIVEKSADFFDNLSNRIENNEIYIGFLNNNPVSFGLIEKSILYSDVASIGMYSIPEKRQSGVGRNTLLKLKEICYNQGITPIAGCWYYNHNSKKTLESAGMFSQTRLLVITI